MMPILFNIDLDVSRLIFWKKFLTFCLGYGNILVSRGEVKPKISCGLRLS